MNITPIECADALKAVRTVEWIVAQIRDYTFGSEPQLIYVVESLQKKRYFGWNDFIEKIIHNSDRLSEKWVLQTATKCLKHNFRDLDELWMALLAITEEEVLETIILTLNDEINKGVYVFGDGMNIGAGSDQTMLIFNFQAPLSSSEQKILIKRLSEKGYYKTYRMTVTPDYIIIKLCN